MESLNANAWMALFESMPWLWYLVTLLVGLTVGSFLNVVILRLPRMLEQQWRSQCRELLEIDDGEAMDETVSLSRPRSRCPECGHAISALENIPLLSYLFLRGRCRECGTRISIQYPLVELVTGILSVLVAYHFGPSWQAVAALVLTWALVALSVIDLRTTLLPDDITLPLLWLGILLAIPALFVDLQASVLGAVFGYLALWLVYHAFRLLTGKEGMGYGDFKLLALLGAWLGWQSLPLVILLSSFVGAVVGVSMILFRGHERGVPIPFGPYLAAAGWITLLWGGALNQAYLHFAGLA